MVLARWEKPVTDAAGNLITGLMIEVRDENAEGNPLAAGLCSDRDGEEALDNPFLMTGDVPFFHAPGGCYSVRVYKTGVDQTFRYQAVGTGAEHDNAAGSGDISGPEESSDGELAVFDGIDGKKLKRGGLLSATWASMVHALSGKSPPVDADELGIIDSAASNVGKRLTFANLATWIGTKLGPLINGVTGKTTPVDADQIVIADSAASQATKKVTWANIKTTLKSYFDTLYVAAGGGGYTLLGSIATTSGTSQSLTVDLTGKKFVRLVFKNVTRTGTAGNLNVTGLTATLVFWKQWFHPCIRRNRPD